MPTPRHLIVDARTVRPEATGVGHYVAGILHGLDRVLANEASCEVTALRLAAENARTRAFWESLSHVTIRQVPVDYESHPAGDLWLNRDLPRLVNHLGGDVLFSPAFLSTWRKTPFKRLVGILDTIAWDEPEDVPWKFRHYLKFAARRAVRHADRVLAMSPDAARRVRYHRLGGRQGVGILPPGVSHELFHPANEEVHTLPDGTAKTRPLLLYTASFTPRKNHGVLFEAMRLEPLSSRNAELVLLHGDARHGRRWLARRAGDLPVRMVAPHDMADVAAWTRAADVVVFPSLLEGFGLPALEAMASGTPLVASDIEAMHRLTENGAGATLVNPTESSAWSYHIAEAIDRPPEIFDRCEHALRRARRYTWERSARILLSEAARLVSR